MKTKIRCVIMNEIETAHGLKITFFTQATKFGGNDWAICPHLLNKVNHTSLPCFHWRIFFGFIFLFLEYSVLVFLENCSSVFVVGRYTKHCYP